jgi:7,8-dihydropterin-6-yl-methyl-4-(beta-D-ribofuranosyl)aminobenzene 5'-phosphate synthase
MKMSMIRNLKITTLADNLVLTKCLGQWGLSFLLEFVDTRGNSRKVVFDTGIEKKALIYNIKKLELDMSDVDCVVISHGHLDHTATTVEIVNSAGGVNVYAHPHTFLPRFRQEKNGKRRQMGVPKGEGIEDIEKAGGKIIFNTEAKEIVPGLWTTGQIDRMTSFERALPLSKGERTIILVDGKEVEDRILDDQAVWTNIDKAGTLVITGCAHAGLVNTLLQVKRISERKLYGFAGGTHLVGRSHEYLQSTIKELRKFALTLISPCHCTGFKAMAKLWQSFPDEFVLNFAGRVIDTEKEVERLF